MPLRFPVLASLGLIYLGLLSMAPAFAADTSLPGQQPVNSPATTQTNIDVAKGYQKAAALNDASFVTEIVFNSGSSELSADGKSQVRDIVTAAQGKGKIKEIKVLAWADKDYPKKAGRLGRDDMKLADERSQEIDGYITDTFKGIDVDVHNMAENPVGIEKLLRTNDTRVKKSLETAGLAHPAKTGMPSKAGRALVLVIVQ